VVTRAKRFDCCTRRGLLALQVSTIGVPSAVAAAISNVRGAVFVYCVSVSYVFGVPAPDERP